MNAQSPSPWDAHILYRETGTQVTGYKTAWWVWWWGGGQYGGHGGRKPWLLPWWFENGFPTQIFPSLWNLLSYRHKWLSLLCTMMGALLHVYYCAGSLLLSLLLSLQDRLLWTLWWISAQTRHAPVVGRLLSISHQVSGETQTLDSVTSFPKYLSADSKTGMYCAVYQL